MQARTIHAGSKSAARAPSVQRTASRRLVLVRAQKQDGQLQLMRQVSTALIAASVLVSLAVAPPPAEARRSGLELKQEEANKLYQEQLKKMEAKLEAWERQQKQAKVAPAVTGFNARK